MKSINNKVFYNIFTTFFVFQITGGISSVVKTFLLSNFLSPESLTAYGISCPYFSIISILAFSMMVGAQASYTVKYAQGDMSEAKKSFGTAMWASLIISAVITAIGIIFSYDIGLLLGASSGTPVLKETTSQCIKGLFISMILRVFTYVAVPALNLDGKSDSVTRFWIIVTVLSVASNFFAVLVLKTDLFGTTIADAISYLLPCIFLAAKFFSKKSNFSLHPKYFTLKMLPGIMKLGSSDAIYWLCQSAAPTIINIFAMNMAGTDFVSVLSIQSSLLVFMYTFTLTLGDTVFTLENVFYSERDIRELRNIFVISLKNILFVQLPAGVLTVICSTGLARLYASGESAHLFNYVITAVICMGIYVPFGAFFRTCTKYMQAIYKNKYVTILNILHNLVIPVTSSITLFFIFGPIGLFWGIPVTEIISSLICIIVMLIKKNPNMSGLSRYLLISDKFEIPENKVLRFTASKIADASVYSEKVSEFLKENAIEKKLMFRISLCTEEMIKCIIEQGLEARVNSPVVDMRLFVSDNEVTMRIRDNCPLLDLQKKAELWKLGDSNSEAFIGVRMSMKISSGFIYLHTLNSNNMIIKFSVT